MDQILVHVQVHAIYYLIIKQFKDRLQSLVIIIVSVVEIAEHFTQIIILLVHEHRFNLLRVVNGNKLYLFHFFIYNVIIQQHPCRYHCQ